jgi:hypothetical protein
MQINCCRRVAKNSQNAPAYLSSLKVSVGRNKRNTVTPNKNLVKNTAARNVKKQQHGSCKIVTQSLDIFTKPSHHGNILQISCKTNTLPPPS